jgi:hypothetical protein
METEHGIYDDTNTQQHQTYPGEHAARQHTEHRNDDQDWCEPVPGID